MKIATWRGLLALALLMGTGAAQADVVPHITLNAEIIQIDPNLLYPDFVCTRGDGQPCSEAELDNPATYRQLLIVPTGYTASEKAKFFNDVATLRQHMSYVPGSTVYSEAYRTRLLYLAQWKVGGPLGASDAAFAGKVFDHPIRDKALTMNQNSLYYYVAVLKSTTRPELSPVAVIVLFNTKETAVTANATPPNFTRRGYGIARMTAGQIQGTYIGAHEVGHAFLSFVDEYVEGGFENMNITQFDILTPLALLNGSLSSLGDAVGDLFGVYDMNISEILASNGSDNVALSRYPAKVSSSRPSEVYEYEGGMFFGRGTWHDRGNNLMNGSRVMRASDDGFGYAHSASQQRVVQTAFNGLPGRANDRLRNAGPVDGWPLEFGSTTTVMMYDADKNHRWQPTKYYYVQVGWYEREWKTCWQWGFIPYPCYDWKWRTAQKKVYPSTRYIRLKLSSLFGLSSFVRDVVCGLGLGSLLGEIDVCTLTVDEMADAFLPTLKFYLPYQETTVPASQWFTKYWWRFRTYNGRYLSGWTGWSSFYRSF